MRGIEQSPRNTWWTQALHNRMIAAVLAMVVIIPLVASPADDRLVKGVAAVVFEAFALLLALMLVWRSSFEFSRDSFIAFLRTGANVPILGFLVVALISVAGVEPNLRVFSEQAILQLAGGVLLYFVVSYQFRQSKHLSMLVDTLLFLATIVSLSTFGDFLADSSTRGQALYGDHQPLGSVLMMLLPIVVVVAGNVKNKKRQMIALVVSVLTAGSLLVAFTRSAWMGAFAALVVLAIQWLVTAAADKKRNGSAGRLLQTRKHEFVLPAAMAIIAIGFAFMILTQNREIVDRGASIGNYASDQAMKGRQVAWRGAWTMTKLRPWTGWGEGLFPVEQYWFTGLGTPVSMVDGKQVGKISLTNQAHDFYLQTAAELGIPGLILVLAIVVAFIVSSFRRLPEMDEGIRRTLLMGSTASVVAFAVDAISSPTWAYGQFAMFFWLALGIGTSCFRARPKQVVQSV